MLNIQGMDELSVYSYIFSITDLPVLQAFGPSQLLDNKAGICG